MGTLSSILLVFSCLSFLFFGYACLTSPFMVLEFKRYGLSPFRRINGYLQILGALGLLAGFIYLPLAILGSAGLALLMYVGFAVRLKIRDSMLKSLPALFYAVLNTYLFVLLWHYGSASGALG